MARRRFYAPPDAFDFKMAKVALAREESKHLREVLRLQAGGAVLVFDGEGNEYACMVEGFKDKDAAVRLSIIERVESLHPESPLNLTLAVALLKGDKFDLVVQKAAELGVSKIVPVTTARADIKLRDAHDAMRRVERWRRIAIEAAKQSGRARVMKISAPVDLDALLNHQERELSVGTLRVMFAEHDGRSFDELLKRIALENQNISSVMALVGAEGGWEDAEIEQARSADWQIVTLGGRTLRAETAAIVATTLLQHRFGDLK